MALRRLCTPSQKRAVSARTAERNAYVIADAEPRVLGNSMRGSPIVKH